MRCYEQLAIRKFNAAKNIQSWDNQSHQMVI